MKKWILLNKTKTENKDDIIKILLKNRGLTKEREIEEFLHPSLDQLTVDKLGISKRESDRAVIRIKRAIENKESIVVYTDYDADGVCGGAIVWETLYRLDAKVMPYVPHREKEGYGLSKQGIDFIKKKYQAKLIITVDHGISAVGQVDYAKRCGIETIILDHHLKSAKLPKAKAFIHTTKLAAGGIAWVFCNYLLEEIGSLKRSDLYGATDNLDLAAIATIADMVPLLGPNRVIVKYGLKKLNKTRRLGLNALIKETGLKKGELGVYEVGHILAPRINAMGRLGYALDSLRLICTKDRERAEKLARVLSLTNRERQVLTEEATEHAISNIKDQKSKIKTSKELDKLIFISHKSYKEGIIGLVAGKLVERFGRPAIVVAERKEHSKASARSVSGFNIIEAIRKVSYLLEDVGGHPMAAGFTLPTKNIEELKRRFLEVVEESLDEEKLKRNVKIDLEIDLSTVTPELYTIMAELAPFGVGNPQPVFASRKITFQNARLVGREKQHLKLLVSPSSEVARRDSSDGGTKAINAIAFNMGNLYTKLSPRTFIDIAYNIDEDNWSGNCCLQLKLKDIRV